MRLLLLLVLAFLLLSASPAVSAGEAAGPEPYQAQIIEAARTFDVPPRLIAAIMRQESGFNPWAVNVAGRGHMPGSREDALHIANQAWAAGKSFDVGLMQINSYWLRRFGFTPEYVIDPERNIIIGTWILAQEIKRYGLGWQAVASYHTPVNKNTERARKYAAAVISHLKQIPPVEAE